MKELITVSHYALTSLLLSVQTNKFNTF